MSAKKVVLLLVTLIVLLAAVVGGLSLMQWSKERTLKQDLELARNYLNSQNKPLEAEQILAPLLDGAPLSANWVPEAMEMRLQALQETDPAKAMEVAQKVLELDGKGIDSSWAVWSMAHLEVGQNAIDNGKISEARQHFEMLMENGSETAKIRAELGLARLDLASPGGIESGRTRLKSVIAKLEEGDVLRTEAELILGKANMRILLSRQPYETLVAYEIQPKDTLETVCLRYRVTAEALLEKNPSLSSSAPLPVGEVITIPAADAIYEIKSGDTIYALAKKFRVSQELIMNVNNIENPSALRIGRRLKIPNLELSIAVNKSDNTLTLYNYGKFLKKYRVRTGEEPFMTPVGEYKVLTKILDPEWTNPRTNQKYAPGDPGNELGAAWMGFKGTSLGLHEAIDAKTVGTYSSNGCVGLAKEDILELYSLVPNGTPITIEGDIMPQQTL